MTRCSNASHAQDLNCQEELDIGAKVHATMSDYEDEMEIDGSTTKDAITFSSNNTNAKGKRTAANLPVEAEDSLPWSVLGHLRGGRAC